MNTPVLLLWQTTILVFVSKGFCPLLPPFLPVPWVILFLFHLSRCSTITLYCGSDRVLPEHAPDFSQPCSPPGSTKEPTRTHFPVLPPLPPHCLPAPEFSVSYKSTMHCWDLGLCFWFGFLFCSVLNTFKQGMHSPAFQEFIPLHKCRILTGVIFLETFNGSE